MNLRLHNSYTTLPAVFYAYMSENPVKEPKWLVKNEALAAELGIELDDAALELLSGNQFPEDLEPIAQSYAGHQFGHFNMLGDGRATLLGELAVGDELIDVQLKGAGETPYSRGGDGRAAVGPMLREYIISEAMHALGIPTTRSLAVVATGEPVQRERLLDGAILTRLASSHLRVGTFEFAARFTDDVQALADYAIERHYPALADVDDKYLMLFAAVVEKQASLIAQWQLVGFVHGVMNTDNMTISGETIDYGPCAFIDEYDLSSVYSSIDRRGRYAFGNQPQIGGWNLARLAESLLPLIDEDSDAAVEKATEVLESYGRRFHNHLMRGMRAKLGLDSEMETYEELIKEWLRLLEEEQADYTNAFRALSEGRELDWMKKPAFTEWFTKWEASLKAEGSSLGEARKKMLNENPAIIPRNYYVDEAIRFAERGDLSKFEVLVRALQSPYALDEELAYLAKPPKGDLPFVTYCGT